ncbi:CapA family protein [Mesobacillus zeae]|uniref:CapA family protein n=1 Tax=Mesobacillus zeae TaxID=1917180 RepID=A0A398BDF5_9BACI|nr:CapA family protein [Mesobacillus zeae]RID85790.1 CapA family protein [Mesobacillus zeae]
MRKKRYALYVFIISFLLVIASSLLIVRMYQSKGTGSSDAVQTSAPLPQKKASEAGKELEEKVTLGAIGDILIHDRVYIDAMTKEGYDFKPMLASVKDILIQPDLLLANQETVLGGIELGLSGYPAFNSPREVGDAIIDSGVDIVSTANNHSLDKGEKGIQSAIGYMETTSLPYVGAFKDPEDKKKLRILEENGVKIAYLSYTYGTNGIPVPEGKDYLVNLIDRAAMKEEIRRARQNADAVVMSIHWGNEYERTPNNSQKDLAKFLADEGVDVIFGHHPHVLQPMEWIEAEDGRKTLIVYSLGNFLSGQVRDYKDIGGLVTVELTKNVTPGGNSITVSNPEFTPTYVASQAEQNYRVVLLKNAGSHGLPNAEEKYKEIMAHMNGPLSP